MYQFPSAGPPRGRGLMAAPTRQGCGLWSVPSARGRCVGTYQCAGAEHRSGCPARGACGRVSLWRRCRFRAVRLSVAETELAGPRLQEKKHQAWSARDACAFSSVSCLVHCYSAVGSLSWTRGKWISFETGWRGLGNAPRLQSALHKVGMGGDSGLGAPFFLPP